MRLNVLLTPELSDEMFFNSKTSVVIDVLRASNTIITALDNGAKEIIPVSSVDGAVKISKGLFGGTTILGGERNTKKIEGFHLGNSPLEYTSGAIKGKSIVLFTTNGSKAVVKAKFSESLFVCSFANLSAVVNKILSLGKDIEILCAGNTGAFSMEDVICAGMIADEAKKQNDNYILSDSAKAASLLYNSVNGNILEMLKQTEHGILLQKNGYAEDINYCSKVNTTEVIPYLSGNVIKLLPGK
jgi:2-phosphosulfolactate phosphatase